MMYPLGMASTLDTPGEYRSLRSGPAEAPHPLFIGLGARCISLWSFSPPCLLSHHEWRPPAGVDSDPAVVSLSAPNVVYEEISRWTAAEWRTIDVLRGDGLVDRFGIVDTSVSIFPVISRGATNLPPGMCRPSLATVPLGLRYEATVDPAGRPLMATPNSHYVPISVSSRLYQTADGLLGQVTSDGFFAFELRLPTGHYIDVKASKLFMSCKTHAEIDRRTSFSVGNGLLAVCGPRHVRVYDLYQAESPLVTKINNGLPQAALSEVAWVSEDEVALLAGDGIILVNVHDGSQAPIKLPGQEVGEGTASPLSPYSNLIVCPQRTCLLLLGRHGHCMVRLALARPLDTCGRLSKLVAYVLEGRQLHLLAVPSALFSSERPGSGASLRDQTMAWKALDVPFQTYLQGSINGPIRLACQDGGGQWILLAGRTGFCIFNHLGNGHGHWTLLSDPQESETFAVKVATWVQLEATEQAAPPVLSLCVWFEERRQHEFLLFTVAAGRRFLSLHGAAHRQTVEGRIIALHDCSQGVLAILLEDAVLQLVQLSVREPPLSPLRMSLILRASLDGILTMGALTKTTRLTYVRDQALLLVQNDDGLLGVVLSPSSPPSADQGLDIGAKLLIKGRISDFVVWPTGGGRYWILAQVGQRIYCRQVPLATDCLVELAGTLSSFYPSHAHGLYLRIESMGSGTMEHAYRLAVADTGTFVVPLLYRLISLEGDDEGAHFYQLARSLDRRDIGAFSLILEMLLERILTSTPVPQQSKLYRCLKYRLQDLVTGSEYRQILFRFLRRVEAEDARRVMALLGPFGELFERALRGEELLAAWSFYRVAATGTADEREECRLPARSQSLLEKALEGRQLAIMRGVLRLAEELRIGGLEALVNTIVIRSGERRDWPTLEMLHSEGRLSPHRVKFKPDAGVDHILANCMLHSRRGRNELLRSLAVVSDDSDDGRSRVAGFLRALSLPIESALWSCIVDGRGYEQTVLEGVIGLGELTSIIRNTYDIL